MHGLLARAVDLGAWIDPRPLGVARELLAAERVAWVQGLAGVAPCRAELGS
jgi:hypothetical protein